MTNLLQNPSFEDGHYHWHDVAEIVIPNGWDFWYLEDSKTRLERQDNDFLKPETVVWNIKDAPENERSLFFLGGNFCLKIFKGWGPLWWRLFQKVSGLNPGGTYRFTAPVYPDLVAKYEFGKKVYAPDMLSGEHKLIVKTGGKTFDTGWMDGNKVKFGQYNFLTLDFVADSTEAEVSIEVRGRWGLDSNGWFTDDCSLERIADADLRPEPTPVPVPTPVTAPIPSPTPAPAPNPTPLPDGADAYYMPLPKAMQRWRARLARSHIDNLRKQNGLMTAQYSLLESLWWALDYLVGKKL